MNRPVFGMKVSSPTGSTVSYSRFYMLIYRSD